MTFIGRTIMVLGVAAALGASAQEREITRIAFIDALSGPFAHQGLAQLKMWQFAAQRLGGKANPAGVRFEVVGMDNKGTPQESINALKSAVDQGYRYVAQGMGSGAGLALIDAIGKHNERNPGKEVLYLNYAAVDPAMTNEKCSFWHFRFDADTSMKMEALTAFLKDQPSVRKVYLFNQNYSHGHQVARYFKDGIARKRPDLRIIGEELHPLGQVKDFAPYVAKIRQSGADAIVTGNWGPDLTLLVKSMHDSGLKIPLYTVYANATGTPAGLASSASEIYGVAIGHPYHGGEFGRLMGDFQNQLKEEFATPAIYNGLLLLGTAIAKAEAPRRRAPVGPAQVARAMEGLSVKSFAGEVVMRGSDHQLQQALFVTRWQKVDHRHSYDVEGTGHTFVPVKQLDAYTASTLTSCQMQRPAAS